MQKTRQVGSIRPLIEGVLRPVLRDCHLVECVGQDVVAHNREDAVREVRRREERRGERLAE
jgi:hypothetical protein